MGARRAMAAVQPRGVFWPSQEWLRPRAAPWRCAPHFVEKPKPALTRIHTVTQRPFVVRRRAPLRSRRAGAMRNSVAQAVASDFCIPCGYSAAMGSFITARTCVIVLSQRGKTRARMDLEKYAALCTYSRSLLLDLGLSVTKQHRP